MEDIIQSLLIKLFMVCVIFAYNWTVLAVLCPLCEWHFIYYVSYMIPMISVIPMRSSDRNWWCVRRYTVHPFFVTVRYTLATKWDQRFVGDQFKFWGYTLHWMKFRVFLLCGVLTFGITNCYIHVLKSPHNWRLLLTLLSSCD